MQNKLNTKTPQNTGMYGPTVSPMTSTQLQNKSFPQDSGKYGPENSTESGPENGKN